jgi:hypothetical protein
MAAAAFQNPALRAPNGLHDACAEATPVRVVVQAVKRGTEMPDHVELSCTKKAGLCLTKEEAAELEAARQAACRATGVDLLRFQKVAPDGPAVGRDRVWERDQRDVAALQNLERMAQNAFAAAGYSTARLSGAKESNAQAIGQVAGVAGDAVLAVGVAYAGMRAARAPAPAKLDQSPPTPAEVKLASDFLIAHGTPPDLAARTLDGFATGIHVEAMKEDLHVFRYTGSEASARGRWVTEQPATRPVSELALDKSTNPATHMAEWVIPKGTEVLRGTVAPLNSQPGGTTQVFVPDPTVLREP